MKSDYIASLKQGAYLPSLLSFTTDFLGHTIGKPVDATRFSIQTYTPELSPSSSPERDAQHLLTHLYYLSLTHLPSLSKSWYLDITSRQASLSLSSWTEKYISPLIIRNELSTVSEWTAAGQSTSSFSNSDDDTKLQIRVSQSTKEVSAGYEVDEQMMQIVIRLPPMYPLRQATVESVHRVGVTEKKWQSWLINTQGVIQFSVSLPFLSTSSSSSTISTSNAAEWIRDLLEWFHHRWPHRLAPQRPRRHEGPIRMCNLLLHHQRGQTASQQALCHLQEPLPLRLSLPVVQEQQRQ